MTRMLRLTIATAVAFIAFLPASAVSLPKAPGVGCSDAQLKAAKAANPTGFATCQKRIEKALLEGKQSGQAGSWEMRCIGGIVQCCGSSGTNWTCQPLSVGPGTPSAPLVPSPGGAAPTAPLVPGTGK